MCAFVLTSPLATTNPRAAPVPSLTMRTPRPIAVDAVGGVSSGPLRVANFTVSVPGGATLSL